MKRCRSIYKKTRERCAKKPSRPAIPIHHTLEDVVAWLRGEQVATGVWACSYCSVRLVLDQVEADHKDPLESGGSPDPENLTPACKLCNQEKGELSALGYMRVIETLKTLPWSEQTYIRTALRNVGIAKRLRFIDRKSAPGLRPPTSY